MDEPTTGLHMSDIAHLLGIIDRLVDGGNTVIVIEHNLDVIRSADWIIDLGPEGGSKGGEVVFEGTPAELVKAKRSLTGQVPAVALNCSGGICEPRSPGFPRCRRQCNEIPRHECVGSRARLTVPLPLETTVSDRTTLTVLTQFP
jgi:hypothetical protein